MKSKYCKGKEIEVGSLLLRNDVKISRAEKEKREKKINNKAMAPS